MNHNSPRYWPTRCAEEHVVGENRIPLQHMSVTTIKARQRLEEVPYRLSNESADLRVLMGGRAISDTTTTEEGLQGTIRLAAPLPPGGTTTLVQHVRLKYDEPPAPVFRRFSGPYGLDYLEIYVRFHRNCYPKQVCRGVWAGLYEGAEVAESEPLPLLLALDSDSYVACMTATSVPPEQVVGMYWQW